MKYRLLTLGMFAISTVGIIGWLYLALFGHVGEPRWLQVIIGFGFLSCYATSLVTWYEDWWWCNGLD